MLALQTLWIQTFLSTGLSTCINHNETAVTGQVSSDCTAHTDKREQSDIKITRFTQKHPETTVSRNTVYKKFKVPEKCNRNISHFSKSLMKWAWDILGGLVKYLMWDIRTGLELEWNFTHYKAVLLYALQSISFLCFILSLSLKHIHLKSGECGRELKLHASTAWTVQLQKWQTQTVTLPLTLAFYFMRFMNIHTLSPQNSCHWN